MSKPRGLFVMTHNNPSSAEAQREKAKYEAMGYDVFVFSPLRPRTFADWSIAEMLNEQHKLSRFIQRAKTMAFQGSLMLHAKVELATLSDILEGLIPSKAFKGLPIVAKGFFNRTYCVRKRKEK